MKGGGVLGLGWGLGGLEGRGGLGVGGDNDDKDNSY